MTKSALLSISGEREREIEKQTDRHTRGGGVLRVLSDEDDRMGAKIKTQKVPRASNRTQKIPGPKINPQ